MPPWTSLDDLEEVPEAKSPFSTRAVRSPRLAASSATPAPVMPPPTTTTSKRSAARRRRASSPGEGPWSPGGRRPPAVRSLTGQPATRQTGRLPPASADFDKLVNKQSIGGNLGRDAAPDELPTSSARAAAR